MKKNFLQRNVQKKKVSKIQNYMAYLISRGGGGGAPFHIVCLISAGEWRIPFWIVDAPIE